MTSIEQTLLNTVSMLYATTKYIIHNPIDPHNSTMATPKEICTRVIEHIETAKLFLPENELINLILSNLKDKLEVI